MKKSMSVELPVSSVAVCFHTFWGNFSDVLCPSVRVEGDRFKHTNGETKEITGKQEATTTQAWFCVLLAGPQYDPSQKT
jgi:hypothetical protein